MGLVATLRELKQSSLEELNRTDGHRPIMIDGSFSELISRALNVVHSKKNFTTGEPFYGSPNPNGEPSPGAGGVGNLFTPDSPRAEIIRPSLESQQQDYAEIEDAASILVDAVDINHDDLSEALGEKPMIVYAIPPDGMVSEKMNESIDTFSATTVINPSDFVFVHTDEKDVNGNNSMRVVNLNQRISEYKDRGAKVYSSLESFLADYDNLKKK